jgi:hypothetical protein
MGRLYRLRPRVALGGGGDSNVIAAEVFRAGESDGPGTARIFIPVKPGAVPTLADVANVVVETDEGSGFVERAVELTAEGRHPDGSYLALTGWLAVTSIAAATPITARVTLNGSPAVARTTPSGKWGGYVRMSETPHLAGFPPVMLVPTDPDYLRLTRLTGPFDLVSKASLLAEGGQAALYWKRFEDFSGWWRDSNAGSGPYGTAPDEPNPSAWDMCNSLNDDYFAYGDLTNISQWIVAAAGNAFVYGAQVYETCRFNIEGWMMSGQREFLIYGLSVGGTHVYELCKPRIEANLSGDNGFAMFPETAALWGLVTGDPQGSLTIEYYADRYRVLPAYWDVSSGFGTSALLSDPCGSMCFDPREMARPMMCFVWAHRLRLTESYFGGDGHHPADYPQWAEDMYDRALQTGSEGHARKADGTWRDQRCVETMPNPSPPPDTVCDPDYNAIMYINTFMQPMLAMAVIHACAQFGFATAPVVALLEQQWATLWSEFWGIWTYSFGGPPITSNVKSMRNDFDGKCGSQLSGPPPTGTGAAYDVTGMYPAVGAWLYAKTGNATYLTQAVEVFEEGVGIGIGGGNGPTLGEIANPLNGDVSPHGRKCMGENHIFGFAYFPWRNGNL